MFAVADLPFRIETDRAVAGAVAAPALADAVAKTAGALDRLRRQRQDGDLPLLQLPTDTDDLRQISDLSILMRKRFDLVAVLGVGGSSLGGRTLCALTDLGFGPKAGAPKLVFLDNVDPMSFSAFLGSIGSARLGCLAISKSGGTAETLAQLLTLLPHLGDKPGERIVAIAEPGDNPLRRLAEGLGAPVIDHNPRIGGRYSALTAVGLLPAVMSCVDGAAARFGAQLVLEANLGAATPAEAPAALGAAWSIAGLKGGAGQTVLMPYCDRLGYFAQWHRQLWAESLGKNGTGLTPAPAMGAIDQHSQLQLYLDGPQDKTFTLIHVPTRHHGTPTTPPAGLPEDPRLNWLVGRCLGDLFDVEARATYETLAKNGRPVRRFVVDTLNEEALGGLMMHFMLETIIAADLLGVDPYDQPAVEEGKALARAYLAEEPPRR